MWSTYLLIFLMLCIGIAGWLLFIWAVKSGQYDDVEGPKYRMLDDERDTPSPDSIEKPRSAAGPTGKSGKNADGKPS